MWRSFKDYLQLVLAYGRINLNAQLEYRGAFMSEAAAMFINDGFWVAFWVMFFSRFPVVEGWSRNDVRCCGLSLRRDSGLLFASWATDGIWPGWSLMDSSTSGCYIPARCSRICFSAAPWPRHGATRRSAILSISYWCGRIWLTSDCSY